VDSEALDELAHGDARRRAAAATRLGHIRARGGVAALAAAATRDPSGAVRAAALAALVRRAGTRRAARAVVQALRDPEPAVRRRAASLAPRLGAEVPADMLVAALADADQLVAEAAAFALGEHPALCTAHVRALAGAASGHDDPLVREAAVAALGAAGHPVGLRAVLAACRDKPAIRRRAVLALAAFDGPEVEAALARARSDRDWQVRDAAELLLDG
jgi:HEAT repeat protein